MLFLDMFFYNEFFYHFILAFYHELQSERFNSNNRILSTRYRIL